MNELHQKHFGTFCAVAGMGLAPTPLPTARNLIGILLYLERGIRSAFIGLSEGKIYELSLLDGPSVSEVDLAFAISATATDADETFSRIKETTKYIVNKYGTDKIHHGLLVFGNAPSRVRDFRRDAFTREEMIRLLDSVPRSSTGDMLTPWDLDLSVFLTPRILHSRYFEPLRISTFRYLNP